MKTEFFKKMVPIFTIVLGISGAFATNAMHGESSYAPQDGYTLNAERKCNIKVQCSNVPNPVCRLNGTTGPQAFAKDSKGNCNQITYKPQN